MVRENIERDTAVVIDVRYWVRIIPFVAMLEGFGNGRRSCSSSCEIKKNSAAFFLSYGGVVDYTFPCPIHSGFLKIFSLFISRETRGE